MLESRKIAIRRTLQSPLMFRNDLGGLHERQLTKFVDDRFGVVESHRLAAPYTARQKTTVPAATNLSRLCVLVVDPQSLQQLGVNAPGDRQSLRRLERSNRLAAVGANHAVHRTLVIAAAGKFRLH